MYFFINHSAKKIVSGEKNASFNISKNLFQVLRDNKWSIGDHIELIDFMKVDKYKIRTMIEEENYHCAHAEWFYF